MGGRGGGCPPVGLGVEGAGSGSLQEVGSLLGYQTGGGGELSLLRRSGTAATHFCCFCPSASLRRRGRQCSTQSPSQDSGVWRGRHHI